MPKTLTVSEVAEYFHVHRITIYRLAANGLLPSFKVGRVLRFNRSDVLAVTKARPKEFFRVADGESQNNPLAALTDYRLALICLMHASQQKAFPTGVASMD